MQSPEGYRSPKPQPVFAQMSPAPLYNKELIEPEEKKKHHKKPEDDDDKRRDPDGWLIPKLEFNAQDLDCAGCCKFMEAINCHGLIRDAMLSVVKRLYRTPDKQPTHQKSIALFVRPMGGVAFTAGDKHKQIHFSTDYIDSVEVERLKEEIEGVVRHEMVHAWQYNGNDTAPMGLIEGVADWVRLKDGFIPPHWSRGGDSWDDGYQNTAYFLDWLEDTYGAGTVVWVNEQMKDKDYSDDMWVELSGGKSVEELWEMYTDFYGLSKPKGCKGKAKAVVVKPVVAAAGPDAGGRAIDETTMDVKPIPVYNAAPPPDRTKIIIDQETEPTTLEPSLAGTLNTESSFDPFPFRGEAALAEIFAERLKVLKFDGKKDGKRFVKEFEGLVHRVNPEMSDDDKRLLLTTCFLGDWVNGWYEQIDLDDDLPYSVLVEKLQQDFKGVGGRKAALIDRDAKLS